MSSPDIVGTVGTSSTVRGPCKSAPTTPTITTVDVITNACRNGDMEIPPSFDASTGVPPSSSVSVKKIATLFFSAVTLRWRERSQKIHIVRGTPGLTNRFLGANFPQFACCRCFPVSVYPQRTLASPGQRPFQFKGGFPDLSGYPQARESGAATLAGLAGYFIARHVSRTCGVNRGDGFAGFVPRRTADRP